MSRNMFQLSIKIENFNDLGQKSNNAISFLSRDVIVLHVDVNKQWV